MILGNKHIKPIITWLPLAVLVFLLCSAYIPKTKPKGVKIIVIDAGHGGKDPGCNGDLYKEKDIALGIALKLGALLEKNLPDVKVIYTRKTDDFVELGERAEIANRNKADLFISIHCNAAATYAVYKDKGGKVHYKTFKDKKGNLRKVEVHNPKPFGSSTYVMGISNEKRKMNTVKRENAAILLEDNYKKTYDGFDPESDEAYIVMSLWTGANVEQSASIASKIQEEYVTKAGRFDKGVQRQSLLVLWRTVMPSILTEVGFLTNPEEEKFLGSDKGQNYMASALFRAARRYKDEIEGQNKKYDDELEKQEPLVNENISKGNANDAEQDSAMIANTAVDELYSGFVKEADDAYKAKKYEDALKLYEKCTDQKPEEKYPLAKAEECKKKITELKKQAGAEDVKQKETQNKYNTTLALADKLFSQKKWAEAKTQYQKSLELIPHQVYPQEKLKEVEEQKAQEEALKAKQDAELAAEKLKKDTVAVSPKDIVSNYKNKTPKKDTIVKHKTPETKAGIVFRVQFAISETEPNLKTDKYKNIESANFYKAGSIFKITSGNFIKPDDAINLQNKMRQDGYKDCFVIALKNNQRMDFKEAVKQIASQNK